MKTTINFGSERQHQELLVDTGSSWTWAYADRCSADEADLAECKATKNLFHPVDSDTFHSTGETKYIKYGRGQVTGEIVKDTLSMDLGGVVSESDIKSEIKVDDFPFFIRYTDNPGHVISQDNIGPTAGILGMSPHDDSSGPLLVEHLYQ